MDKVNRPVWWVISIVAALTLVLSASPAYADGDHGNYVDGVGAVTDDWGDNPEVCNGCGRQNTDLVTLWKFGPNPKAATVNWQRFKGGLSADGRAGPRTRPNADDSLVYNSTGSDGNARILHQGRYNGTIELFRGSPPWASPTPSDRPYRFT